MGPMFEEEQWKIVQDDAGERRYGYAFNTLTVSPLRGRIPTKHIQVPTGIFPLLETALCPEELAEVQRDGLAFFLDQGPEGDWYFGFESRGSDMYRYLWRYTPAKLPGWMVAKAV